MLPFPSPSLGQTPPYMINSAWESVVPDYLLADDSAANCSATFLILRSLRCTVRGAQPSLLAISSWLRPSSVQAVTLRCVSSGKLSSRSTHASIACAGAGTLSLAINNVAPSAAAVSNSASEVGAAVVNQTVDIAVDFADPGFDRASAGSFEDFVTSRIDWGDATVEEVPDIIVNELPGGENVLTSGTVAGSHAYAVPGVHTVRIYVRDDDGGETVAETTVYVTGVGLVDDTLYVIGTDGKDIVAVKLIGASRGDDDDDDDDDDGSGSILTVPAFISGGAGNDKLTAGSGDDLVVGGLGKDVLNGRGGGDVLIGGDGKDNLQGKAGKDLLIGGLVDLDDEALADLHALWSGGGSYADRVASLTSGLLRPNITVHKDADRDKLRGGSGRDAFFAQLAGPGKDRVLDDKANEEVFELL
jgi:hypothetical protein